MIYIDLSKLSIPIELSQRLLKAKQDLLALPNDRKARKDFITAHSHLWTAVKPYLESIVGTKCWYCEVTTTRFDFNVDHFRPKSRVKNGQNKAGDGYWWLAFDCENYRLACDYCNSTHGHGTAALGKADQFPLMENSKRARHPTDAITEELNLLLDPTIRHDPGHLAFSEDGRAYPYFEENDKVAYQRAKITIDILNLNDIRIEEARKVLCRRCRDMIEKGTSYMHEYQVRPSSRLKQQIETIFEDINLLVSSRSQFSATARYYFEGCGQRWVQPLLRASSS